MNIIHQFVVIYGVCVLNEKEKQAIEHILSDYKKVLEMNEVLSKRNEVLLKENENLKNSLSWRINYCQELEKDLFENCENHVISKDKIKEKIKEYNKLADSFYNKWKDLSPLDENYRDIKDTGMCCDAKVSVLQELLKG